MLHAFIPGRGLYEEGYKFTNDEVEEMMESEDTLFTVKVDGENAMLMRERDEEDKTKWTWNFYYRQDNPKSMEGLKPLPEGAQPDVYESHHYFYRKLDRDLVTGKGKKKTSPGPDTYAAIQKAVDILGYLSDPNDEDCPDYVPCEWIGTKHQKNVDGYSCEHGIALHGFMSIENFPRTAEEIAKLAKTECYEGVVAMNPKTHRCYKIRLDMFPDSRFKKEKGNKKDKTTQITTLRSAIFWKGGMSY